MSKREELEARIKEQRVLEANKKGLVGFSGKIGSVLRALGQDIVSQDIDESIYGEIEDYPRNSSDLMRQIPTIEIDENLRPETEEWGQVGESYFSNTRKVGMHFDGLSRGMHMEIKYDEESSELSLTYKGFLAYKEKMGDVEAYIPNDEWEGWIERLWAVSKKIQREEKEVEFKKRASEAERVKEDWWRSVVRRWGKI